MRRLLSRLKRRPGSLRARLVASAAIFILAAILVVGLVLDRVLDRIVRGEIATRLELQIATIGGALSEPAPTPGRRPARAREDREDRLERRLESGRLDTPPFDREGSGWYWQVEAQDEILAVSRSLDDESLDIAPRERERRERGPPRRLEAAEGPDGQDLLLRRASVEAGGREYHILASAPLAALQGPLREATATVALTLALLGAALVAAIVLQVRFGLAPVEALRRRLGAVRRGETARIEGEQPKELAPLVDELNALIEQDAVNLRQARLHVANLAHGLKTPLATLSAAAERMAQDSGRTELLGLAGLMDRRIRHHLRRAQTVALGGPARRRTDLAAHVADLAGMLRKFHAGSNVAIRTEGPERLFAAVDGEDLDEMLGNLLDNAFRHARSAIVVAFAPAGRDIALRIGDDGPGLTDAEIALVRQAGRRLDESGPGHGFGLPITIEIAELYGGRLDLGRAAEGGLEATLVLPAAAGAGPAG